MVSRLHILGQLVVEEHLVLSYLETKNCHCRKNNGKSVVYS